MSDEAIRVAVYGSLKRGKGNDGYLRMSRYIKNTTVPGKLYSLGFFPGYIPQEDGPAVHVEVYEVDDETLRRLDRLEGHPNFYERILVDLDDGSKAFIYKYNDSEWCDLHPDRLVLSGNW